jgi:undecaprenyl-diphosphatase
MMKDLTALGSTTILTVVTLIVVGYLLISHKRRAALLVACAVGGGTALSNVFKYTFARPRPDLVAHSVDVYTSSFPSGHAMLSAVTYLTLGALLARVEQDVRTKIYVLSVAVLLTLAIGLSRAYLGVHYPTDVLAGWAVGSAWAMLCWTVAIWLQRRGDIEAGGQRSAAPTHRSA